MKLKKLICVGFDGSELEEAYWKELDNLAEERVLADTTEYLEYTNADGLLVKLGAKLNKSTIDMFPYLKYIGMLGTGFGGIDINHAASRDITVTNIADYATESVAEFAFAILLEYLRDIAKVHEQAKTGDYSDGFVGREIRGKKFGIVGLGRIGERIAEVAQAFGADAQYWSRTHKPQSEVKGIRYAELDNLLAHSDIISLNLALNTDTEAIINAHRINLIKPESILINLSPVELIDLKALIERLTKGDMVFMLDHSDEVDEKKLKVLQHLDNVITYPAVAYLSEEATRDKQRIYIDNLKNFLSNKPTNKVN